MRMTRAGVKEPLTVVVSAPASSCISALTVTSDAHASDSPISPAPLPSASGLPGKIG
jgi:hypothetical protein